MPANRETRKADRLAAVVVSRVGFGGASSSLLGAWGHPGQSDPDPNPNPTRARTRGGEPPERAQLAWVRRAAFFVGIVLYGQMNELGVCFSMSLLLSLHQPSEARGRAGFSLPPLTPPSRGFESCMRTLVGVRVVASVCEGWHTTSMPL